MLLVIFEFAVCVAVFMGAFHFLTASIINYKFHYYSLSLKQLVIGLITLAIDLFAVYICLR